MKRKKVAKKAVERRDTMKKMKKANPFNKFTFSNSSDTIQRKKLLQYFI